MKYYAGIGSRDTPDDVFAHMTEIATLLEDHGYILRSGGATGADTAFEVGVHDFNNMCLYLPKDPFNGHTRFTPGCLYLTSYSHPEDYQKGYESIAIHPAGFALSLGPRNMMIRNYFQVMGHGGQSRSSFIICWTPDGADGINILTSRASGGTGQSIRLAAKYGVPLYNLNGHYGKMTAKELVDLIFKNLVDGINPNLSNKQTITSLF